LTLKAKVGGLELEWWKTRTGCLKGEIAVKAQLIVVRYWRAPNNQIWLEIGTNSTGLCQLRLQSNNSNRKTRLEIQLRETSKMVADWLGFARAGGWINWCQDTNNFTL
jgi:hypothetical protein